MEGDVPVAELYRFVPGEFTAARDALAVATRKAGDRKLAAAIKALRRPTASAWMANWLARERTDELARLFALGGAMRSAQEHLDGGLLRGLSRQSHLLVAALVGEARRGAAEAGLSVSDGAVIELGHTLKAALADETAADLLRTGRLATAQSHTGFGPAGGGPPARAVDPLARHGASQLAPPSGDSGEARTLVGLRQSEQAAERLHRELMAAERDLRTAEAGAGAAHAAVDEAQRQAIAAQAHTDTLAIEISDLEAQIDRLRQQAQQARTVLGAAEITRTDARRAATDADALLSAAERRLSDLARVGSRR